MNQLVESSLILEAEARIGFQFQSFKVSMERLVKNSANKKNIIYLYVGTILSNASNSKDEFWSRYGN